MVQKRLSARRLVQIGLGGKVPPASVMSRLMQLDLKRFEDAVELQYSEQFGIKAESKKRASAAQLSGAIKVRIAARQISRSVQPTD